VRGDQRISDFLAAHASPAVWTDPAMVSDFLHAFYFASPGPAFADQQVTIRIPEGADRLYATSLVTDNPFDARLIAEPIHRPGGNPSLGSAPTFAVEKVSHPHGWQSRVFGGRS